MLSVGCLPEILRVGGIYRHTHRHTETGYIHTGDTIYIYIAYMQYIPCVYIQSTHSSVYIYYLLVYIYIYAVYAYTEIFCP